LAQKYPDLDLVRKVITSEVQAYVHAVTVLSSLREVLQQNGFACHIEKKLYRRDGSHKKPDLLICSDNYIIVDHKYTESKAVDNLLDKIEVMKGYNTKFFLNNAKGEEPTEFDPEVVMLTPEKAVQWFKEFLGCPITWGYGLNDEITIKQSVGSIKDPRVSALFKPDLSFQRAEDIAKYKFITSNTPLPYVACHVYMVLFTLIRPDQTFSDKFEVKYSELLDRVNTLYPPWVSPEIKQLNVKTLRNALHFLQGIGWIRWFESENIVVVDKKKGQLTPDLLVYFIEKLAKDQHEQLVKRYERELKELEEAKKPKEQKSLIDFIPK
jgi:hypothetical protein